MCHMCCPYRLLDSTQRVRSRAVACLRAILTAAPATPDDATAASAARQALGRALLHHSQQLLHIHDRQHDEVMNLVGQTSQHVRL